MDKTQVDAITKAILEPYVRAQEEIHQRRVLKALDAARKRRISFFVLVGCGIGAVAAYFTVMRITRCIFVGGIVGYSIGWFVVWLQTRSPTT